MIGRTVAIGVFGRPSRKVRAPEGRPPGNSWAWGFRTPRRTVPQKTNRLRREPEVRVKRWGKSPPHAWQQAWLGKPRSEQGQIGGERWPTSPTERSAVEGASKPRVGCLRARVTALREE